VRTDAAQKVLNTHVSFLTVRQEDYYFYTDRFLSNAVDLSRRRRASFDALCLAAQGAPIRQVKL